MNSYKNTRMSLPDAIKVHILRFKLYQPAVLVCANLPHIKYGVRIIFLLQYILVKPHPIGVYP